MQPPSDITWKLHLQSPPDQVFSFLNTKAGREKFWAENAPESGGFIHFTFSNGEKYASRIITRKPATTFAIEYFGSIVTFELAIDSAGGTDLTLINTRVAPATYLEQYAGWLSVLLALKAAVDHDVDLRNHDGYRTWDQKYVDN